MPGRIGLQCLGFDPDLGISPSNIALDQGSSAAYHCAPDLGCSKGIAIRRQAGRPSRETWKNCQRPARCAGGRHGPRGRPSRACRASRSTGASIFASPWAGASRRLYRPTQGPT